jgi:hypothetical protein
VALAWPRSRPDGWFYEAERPGRRMKVSWHPEQRMAVLSLWDANTCSATFRLPIEDAAMLSQLLVGYLGEAVQAVPAPERVAWFERLRRRFRPVLAEVVDLVDRRRT